MSERRINLLKQIQQKNRDPNKTKNIIKKMKTQVPVLSTIVDYGGKETVEDILKMDPEDRPSVANKFQKLLTKTFEEDDPANKQQNISFLEYKASPIKHKANEKQKKQRKNTLNKKQKSAIVVEMPQELKALRSEIVNLPSIGASRYNKSQQILLDQSRTSSKYHLDSKFRNRRTATQHSLQGKEQNKNLKSMREGYINHMKDILCQFNSPAIHCNSYIMERHSECKKILKTQQNLQKRYRRFEKLGSPPKRIINLLDSIGQLQGGIIEDLDNQLHKNITNMDQKRYDWVLKHEENNRRMNMLKFMQKKKNEKLESYKISSNEDALFEMSKFKLNSKGKAVFADPKKNIQYSKNQKSNLYAQTIPNK